MRDVWGNPRAEHPGPATYEPPQGLRARDQDWGNRIGALPLIVKHVGDPSRMARCYAAERREASNA